MTFLRVLGLLLEDNIDLEQILSLLNNVHETYGLHIRSWKLPFVLQVSNSEHWNYDFLRVLNLLLEDNFLLFLAL